MAGNRLSNVTVDQVKGKAICDDPSGVLLSLCASQLWMVQGRELFPVISYKYDEDLSSFRLDSKL